MINWKILNNEFYLYDGTFNGLLSVAFIAISINQYLVMWWLKKNIYIIY